MDSVRRALLSDLEQRGFHKIAALWRSFLEYGCTIYLLSDPGYGPRDGYALYWVSRYLPPTTEVDVVPVCGELEEVSTKNLIIIGRLWAFESEKLVSEALGEALYNYAHFRFIDVKRLLQIDTGEMRLRVEEQRWIRDFGVLRLWRQQDTERVIINLSGLGPVGTLGASLAIADSSRSAMMEVEERLPSAEETQQGFVEILVGSEWKPRDDPIVISPSDVTIEVERDFYAAAQPNWPLIHFKRIDDDGDWLYEVRVVDTRSNRAKLLSQNRIEFAVLAAIAKHTEKEPSVYVGRGGYISYEQIAESRTVKEILGPTGLDVPVVRATVSRLRRTLQTPEWIRTFPNLLLESLAKAEKSRRRIAVLRLRGKFRWWDT